MKTNNKKKDYRWIATAVDFGESCDGKAQVLKCFKTKKSAKNYVEKRMDEYKTNMAGLDIELEYDRMSAHTGDYSLGCEWAIRRIEI